MKPSSSLAFFESQSSDSGGCILGVLRRILCSTSLSLASSHNTSSDTCSCSAVKDDDKTMNQAVPGLVARLMGLDSIPERRITRSRSLNSADHFKPQQHDDDGNGDDQRRKLHLHKRSKSSRETPTYIQLDDDDDDFIVLTFDNRNKSSRTNQKRDKTAASSEARIEVAQVAKQQQPPEIESCDQREANSRIKKHMRLVQKKTQSTSSDTEESSPVSIFDFQEPTSTSADDDSWTRSSSSSSRVSSPEQDNTKISTRLEGQDEGDHQIPEEAVEGRHKAALLNNTVVHVNGQKKREMWGIVCNITVAEIKGAADADWCVKEDLAAEFEVHIMDQLLNDLLLLLLHSI